MSTNGDVREDLKLPESDLGKEIEKKFDASEDILVSVCLYGCVCCVKVCVCVFFCV